MKMTSSQRVTLEWLRAHRNGDPSFISAVLFEWPALLVAALPFLVGAWFVGSGANVLLGGILVGMAVGGFATRLGLLGARIKLFRTYRDVTDWAKVDELLRNE